MDRIDTRQPRITIQAPRASLTYPKLRVRVVQGADGGREHSFSHEAIRIGSRAENELPLSDPFVSGLHAELRAQGGGILLRDLGSTNGTWVNNIRIDQGLIPVGARLRVGQTEIALEPLPGESQLVPPAGAQLGPLVGDSPAMHELFARVLRLSATELSVLITGETGSGKEMVARALHQASPRAREPFVAIDCGAIPAALLESELFGFEKGAFTGAERTYRGAFERAEGGTVLLDEVGELPLALQPKLLRALDRLEVRRLGAEQTRPIAARMVAATHRDLARMVNEGSFREDLYYRLAVVELRVPPLRERKSDVPLLAAHLLSQYAPGAPALDPELLAELSRHSWPGNVRELRNAVLRLALAGEPALPQRASVRAPAEDPAAGPTLPINLSLPYKEARDLLLDQFREIYGRELLEKASGSISAASRLAQVDRMTFYRLLQKDEA